MIDNRASSWYDNPTMSKEQTLQKWLPRKRPRAIVYDFDGTLFDSPGREKGEIAYLEGTGKLWPFSGWWGRIETLLPPIVPDPIPESMWIADTVAAYRADRAREDTNCYLMTGRPAKTRRRVQEILDTQNISFDESYYRGMKGQPQFGDTIEIKLRLIRDEIIHPALEVLEIYEDRPEHTSRFCNEAKRWKLQVFIHDILTGKTIEF